VVCEEFEKPMLEAILQKVVMNGQVVSLIDKPKHDQSGAQAVVPSGGASA
jgi:hypothetical protein